MSRASSLAIWSQIALDQLRRRRLQSVETEPTEESDLVYSDALVRHINEDNTSSVVDIDTSQLNQCYQTEFYAILCQLILGLTLNFTILCSIALHIRQRHESSAHRNYHRQKCQNVPVIDLIVTLLSVVGVLRVLTRAALQVTCFYGLCFVNAFCYVHGFANTFLHYLFLWTITLFVQDRYIKHYKQHDYLCKCSHFVLYVTLVCVMFLTTMHILGPVYGFSSYRFLPNELTCSIDWNSRYSCPYYIYSVMLVSAPAFIQLAYWTLRLTHRNYLSRATLGPLCRRVCFCAVPSIWVTCSGPKDTSTEPDIESSSVGVMPPPSTQSVSTNSTVNGNSIEGNSFHRLQRHRSAGKSTLSRHTATSRTYSSSGIASSSSSGAALARSQLLTDSKELLTVALCSWIFVLSFVPKLFDNACQACNISSHYRNTLGIKYSFYITYLDETASSVLIPLVLIMFHGKLRFSLILCLDFWIQLCCRRGKATDRKRNTRRQSSSNSGKRTKLSESTCMTVPINRSSSLPGSGGFHLHGGNELAVTAI